MLGSWQRKKKFERYEEVKNEINKISRKMVFLEGNKSKG